MKVSAVSCTPIKPQASFGHDDTADYELVKAQTQEVDKFVNSAQIKKPVAAVASIALAAVMAYAGGAKIGNVISRITKGKVPEAVVGFVKKGADKVQDTAANIIANADKTTKLGKIKNLAGKAMGGAEKYARKGFKKLAKEGSANPTKAFETMLGLGSVATVFPGVITRDKDGDGVSDILQRGQNAYTGTQTRMDNALEKVGFIADLVDSLT